MFKKSFSTEMSGDKKTIEKRFRAISKSKRRVITIISISAAVLIALSAAVINGAVSDSAKVYPDIEFTDNTQSSTGYKTIGDYAEELNMDFSDFLEAFGLPADTPPTISADEASGLISLGKIARASGYSLEELKSFLELPDDIGADTQWAEAISQSKLYPTRRRGHELSSRLHYILGDSANYMNEIRDVYTIDN